MGTRHWRVGLLGLWGAQPPPPTPPAGACGTRCRIVRGLRAWSRGAGPGMRAVGGAGIIIPAEAGQGAAAPYRPPLSCVWWRDGWALPFWRFAGGDEGCGGWSGHVGKE